MTKRWMRQVLGVGSMATLLATGCAHMQSASNSPQQAAQPAVDEPRTVSQIIQKSETPPPSSSGEPMIVRGIKLQNTQFDFPVVVNTRVEQWVDYFTGRGRPYFEKYLERSELFVPYIQPILRQNGMPEDLVYLAMIESGFNNHARSSAKAVGPWQFISATGKRYGLEVNWWVDERRDTRKSTLAAVEYLKDLYQMFQSWELAAAAYNAGEAKVARAIRRFETMDFWAISKQRFLRPETRDYVPKIIAAAIIAKNRKQFGFPESAPVAVKSSEDEIVAGDGAVVKLEKESAAEAALAAEKSPIAELIQQQSAMPGAVASVARATEKQNVQSVQTAESKALAVPNVSKSGGLSGEQIAEFDVQSPADLLQVAHASGLSYATVKSLNPDLLRWCTPPTKGTYRVKLPSSVKEKFLAAYNHIEFPKKVNFLAYKVRGGETIEKIARHFGIRYEPIVDLNRINMRASLNKGAKIYLPMPTDQSRSIASLEVRDAPSRRVSKRARKRSVGRKSSSSATSYQIRSHQREAARIASARDS